jgi:hypothetical protein
MNDSGRESGLTLNVWEYSNVSLDMAKVIINLDEKKGFRKGVIKEAIEAWIKPQQQKDKGNAS